MWISTAEKLPEIEVTVFVTYNNVKDMFNNNPGCYVAYCYFDETTQQIFWYSCDLSGEELETPDFWMPIPNLPKT